MSSITLNVENIFPGKLLTMESTLKFDNATLFAYWAGNDPDKWIRIQDWPIFHRKFGKGNLVSVESRDDGPLLHIEFEDEIQGFNRKRFLSNAFMDGFFVIDNLPDKLDGIEEASQGLKEYIRSIEERKAEADRLARKKAEFKKRLEAERLTHLEEKRKQREKEADSANHFLRLKEKYGVTGYRNTSPTSPLYKILILIDENESLGQDDISWLERKRLYKLSADYYERLFERTYDGWNLVHAGKYWRLAKQPTRAIRATLKLETSDAKLRAAALTNQGGAFRDTDDFDRAIECAEQAINLQPNSHYPYNLLGAIYYQQGDPETGDTFFQKALDLGATPNDQDDQIRNSIDRSGQSNQRSVAEYLLKKDPKRYKWAEYYLE